MSSTPADKSSDLPQSISVENEPDMLLDVAQHLDTSFHADTFNYMAPPSPPSPSPSPNKPYEAANTLLDVVNSLNKIREDSFANKPSSSSAPIDTLLDTGDNGDTHVKAPPPSLALSDTLLDVGDSLNTGLHDDKFSYMAPPSPASPFEPAPSCTRPHSTGALGLGEALGVPVEEPKIKLHDTPIVDEWMRKNAAELERKAKESQARHQLVLEQANKERQDFYARRTARIEKTKAENRGKEKAYIASLSKLNNSKNEWSAVASLIELDKCLTLKPESSRLMTIDLSKPGTSSRKAEFIKPNKPGGETDLTRMRQVLLKLKQCPPKGTS